MHHSVLLPVIKCAIKNMLLERLVMPVPLVHPEHLRTDVYSLTGVNVCLNMN